MKFPPVLWCFMFTETSYGLLGTRKAGGGGERGGVESRSFSVHANSRTIDIKVAAIISTLLFQSL